MIRIWPWSRIADLKQHIFYAERGEELWRERANRFEQQLMSIKAARSARSAHSRKSAATRRAKVLRKAEEMRGEGA